MPRWMKLLMEEAGDGAGGGGSFLSGASSGAGDGGGSVGDSGSGAGAAASGGTGEGSAASDWRSSLPEELRNEGALKAIQDIPSLAKSFIHAQKMVGADKVVLPGKHATEADWKAFYQKVGLPAEAKDYKLEAGDMKVGEDYMKQFSELAHKLNVLPKQAQEMLKFNYELAQQQTQKAAEAEKTKIATGLNNLKAEWGEATERNRLYALKAAEDLGGKDFLAHMDKSGLGNDPQVLKFLAKVGQTLFKEGELPHDGGAGSGALTPAEAMKKANDIIADSKHPYHDKGHPNHQAAVKEVNGYFESAYGRK